MQVAFLSPGEGVRREWSSLTTLSDHRTAECLIISSAQGMQQNRTGQQRAVRADQSSVGKGTCIVLS